MIYGYARVSTRDQNLDRQIIALIESGVAESNIFIDKWTGTTFDRPSYQQMIDKLQPNDLIVIKSIDRLGRNYAEILEQWQLITKIKEADVKVIDMPLLDTTNCKDILGTFIADLVLQILSFQAEQERLSIKQRQAEGIAAARLKGVKFGRPRKSLPDNFEELYQRWLNGETATALAREQNVMSESTFRTRLRERHSESPQDNID